MRGVSTLVDTTVAMEFAADDPRLCRRNDRRDGAWVLTLPMTTSLSYLLMRFWIDIGWPMK